MAEEKEYLKKRKGGLTSSRQVQFSNLFENERSPFFCSPINSGIFAKDSGIYGDSAVQRESTKRGEWSSLKKNGMNQAKTNEGSRFYPLSMKKAMLFEM